MYVTLPGQITNKTPTDDIYYLNNKEINLNLYILDSISLFHGLRVYINSPYMILRITLTKNITDMKLMRGGCSLIVVSNYRLTIKVIENKLWFMVLFDETFVLVLSLIGLMQHTFKQENLWHRKWFSIR